MYPVRVDFAEARVYPDAGVLVRGWFASRVYKLGTALLRGQNLTLNRRKYSTVRGCFGSTWAWQALLDGQILTLNRWHCSRKSPGQHMI